MIAARQTGDRAVAHLIFPRYIGDGGTMDRMRPRPQQPEPEQPAVPAQPLAEVRDVAALPDALARTFSSEDREALARGLAAANASHPLLHAKGNVASYVGGDFVITDLSAKRPSLPDDRFAKVRALADLDKGDRARVDLDVAAARAAGRLSSWPELLKAWDAADARKDARAVLMCAACFVLYDEMRKSIAPPAQKAPAQPAQERPAPPPRETPKREEPLPKVQAAMLKRFNGLSDDEKARLRRHPLPRKLSPTEFPFSREHLLEEWRRFTAESIERFKRTNTQSEPDNDDQVRFAALYAGLERREARSQQELVNIATKQLGGDPASPPAKAIVSPAPKAPTASAAPASLQGPAPPPALAPWQAALERAQEHVKSEERVKTADLKACVSEAAILVGTGADPRDAARAAYDTATALHKDDSGRPAAALRLYAAALASRVPSPSQIARMGPWALERDADADSENVRTAPAPKKSAVAELITSASRPREGAEVTPSLVHSRLRAEYATAYLDLELARMRTDWRADFDEKAQIQKTWLLAHAVTLAAKDLPTDWHGNADDLFR